MANERLVIIFDRIARRGMVGAIREMVWILPQRKDATMQSTAPFVLRRFSPSNLVNGCILYAELV